VLFQVQYRCVWGRLLNWHNDSAHHPFSSVCAQNQKSQLHALPTVPYRSPTSHGSPHANGSLNLLLARKRHNMHSLPDTVPAHSPIFLRLRSATRISLLRKPIPLRSCTPYRQSDTILHVSNAFCPTASVRVISAPLGHNIVNTKEQEKHYEPSVLITTDCKLCIRSLRPILCMTRLSIVECSAPKKVSSCGRW